MISAVQRFLPRQMVDDVSQICASVAKPDDLARAERDLIETKNMIAKATKRQGVILERLTIDNPTTAAVTMSEEHAFEAENRELSARVTELQSKAAKLKAEIDRLMPQYVQAIALALAPFRARAAEQLEGGIAAMEAALKDIDASNQALRGLGRSTPSVMAMPMAGAYRALAAKVARERRG